MRPELAEGLTIEQLSARSGVSPRNIRAYQSRGLIPAPQTRPGSRVAYYDRDHLARLRLIDRLQQRGFSLAGIADLLDAWTRGDSLDQVLGLEVAVAESSSDESIELQAEDLHELLPDSWAGTDALEQLCALGVIERRGDSYRLSHPQILNLGIEAARAGVPVQELISEFRHVEIAITEIAQRFAALYQRHVWEPYRAAGLPPDRLDQVTAQLRSLRYLAESLTRPLMADALTDAIEGIARDSLPAPRRTPVRKAAER